MGITPGPGGSEGGLTSSSPFYLWDENKASSVFVYYGLDATVHSLNLCLKEAFVTDTRQEMGRKEAVVSKIIPFVNDDLRIPASTSRGFNGSQFYPYVELTLR